MTSEAPPRRGLLVALVLIVIAVGAALWLPRWWENRLYRQAEAIAGVGSRVLPGSVTDARKKIDPGKRSQGVVLAIGRPSIAIRTEGSSTHEIWTYYYADGTMTVNLTDDILQRVSLDYGPPKIRKSARP